MTVPINAGAMVVAGANHFGPIVAAHAKNALVPLMKPVLNSLQEHLGKQIVNFTQDKLCQYAHQFVTKNSNGNASSASALRKRLDGVKGHGGTNASSKSSLKKCLEATTSETEKCPEATTSETARLEEKMEQLAQKFASVLNETLSELDDLKQKLKNPQDKIEQLEQKLESALSELEDLKQKLEKPRNESDKMKSSRTATEEAIHETQEMARLTKMLGEAQAVAKIQKKTLDWIGQYI